MDKLSTSNSTHKGMVQSEMSKPTLIFFFTARAHTTKSTVKIIAANTHCKYFLKIAKVTHFFCTRNRLYRRFVQPLLVLTSAVTSPSQITLELCCYLSTDAMEA
jgi:hypothetical protein